MLNYQNVCETRQWQACIGLTQIQFELIAEHFKTTYDFFYGPPTIDLYDHLDNDLKNCLFFVLFQIKNDLHFDILGVLIQSDGIKAKDSFERHLRVLKFTLERQNIIPKRNFANPEEFIIYLKENKDLVLDGNEQIASYVEQENDKNQPISVEVQEVKSDISANLPEFSELGISSYYFSFPNSGEQLEVGFLDEDKSTKIEEDASLYELITDSSGKKGTFRLLDQPWVMRFARDLRKEYIDPVCRVEDFSQEAQTIKIKRYGQVVLINGLWRVELNEKAVIQYILTNS